MRISDWSSDVCSSDLLRAAELGLDFLDASFVEAVLFARGVIFGVFLEVAVLARLFDRRNDLRPHLALALAEFFAQLLGAAQGHRKIGRASCRERVCQYV